jgi:predicted RNase H-like nuclease
MQVVGADVWGRGWIAVAVRNGDLVSVRSFDVLDDLVAACELAAVIGVDIPIGLPDPPPRRADIEARSAVGPRGSSVFPALPGPLLEKDDYADALAECRRRYGFGISKQAFNLGRRIREAAQCEDPRLHEVHPEVAFAAMAGRHLQHSKRTWNGQMERRGLLASEGLVLPEVLDGRAGSVPPDDILDAAAVAWSAHRIARGEAQTLPRDPEPGEPVIWV